MGPLLVSDRQFDILIIGGGFSGTMLAVHLLQDTDLSIAVIDRGTLPGRGLAYGSPHQFHLLNVPAGEMSAHGPTHPMIFYAGQEPTTMLRCRRVVSHPAPSTALTWAACWKRLWTSLVRSVFSGFGTKHVRSTAGKADSQSKPT